MRHVIMLNRISLDGYFASLNEETWGMDWFVGDPEVDKKVHQMGDTPVDTILLGATTYKGFEQSWVPVLQDPDAPQMMRETAEALTNQLKLVFSTTLKQEDITWKNTELHQDNLINHIQKIKAEDGGNILILGSGSIVQQLADHGLIDEYIFIVSPVIAGRGKSMFDDINEQHLTLKETAAFDSGNVVLHYVRN